MDGNYIVQTSIFCADKSVTTSDKSVRQKTTFKPLGIKDCSHFPHVDVLKYL